LPKLSLEIGLAVFGLVLTIVLLVLDKAEKLKGPVLYRLLALAAVMTLPLVLGNPFVAEASASWKYWLRTLAVSGVALIYWAIGIWISPKSVKPDSSQPQAVEAKPQDAGPPPPASDFDDRPSEWRLEKKPDDLVLRDLFLTDFKSVQQRAYGAVFVDDNKQISVQYAINVEPALRTKFLSFYIGRQDHHTAEICEYLSEKYRWILDNAPQLLIEQKNPGDSGTTSTKDAQFSGRIFVYHETYLPAEVTVKLTGIYKTRGLSAIFRSTDYLSSKKMEANLLKLRKGQAAH
jgi:hypothetical protein